MMKIYRTGNVREPIRIGVKAYPRPGIAELVQYLQATDLSVDVSHAFAAGTSK